MRFEHTGIEEEVRELALLDDIMEENGFVRAGAWDYERLTYDYKIEVLKDVYYLRVQGYTVEGEIDTRHAVIQLMTPILGKHYYPHGVEYDEEFPENIVSKCEDILKKVKEHLTAMPK
jgi:hypothetical protein